MSNTQSNYPKVSPKTAPNPLPNQSSSPAVSEAVALTRPKVKRQQFTADFKKAAVSLVLDQKLPVKQAATQVGISHQALRNWVKAVEEGKELAASSPKANEHDMYVLRLEAECRRLRKEVHLLKKLQAYLVAGKI